MILCIDVGNTNIKYGLYDNDKLFASFRVESQLKRTSDEYGQSLVNMFRIKDVKASQVEGAIVSSVIPSIDYTIDKMCQNYLGIKPIFVTSGIKTGLNIKVDNPKEVGADRIVNCVAAIKKYGAPVIVVDFGTATTFNVVNAKGEFVGGVIAPGIKPSMDSLVNCTAKLPRVEIASPKLAIGKNTTSNMQAGIVYGWAGLVEFIIKKITKELKADNVKAVATGGFSETIAKETCSIGYVDKTLTLEGLKCLYDLNFAEVNK